jgi:hypothetical protein
MAEVVHGRLIVDGRSRRARVRRGIVPFPDDDPRLYAATPFQVAFARRVALMLTPLLVAGFVVPLALGSSWLAFAYGLAAATAVGIGVTRARQVKGDRIVRYEPAPPSAELAVAGPPGLLPLARLFATTGSIAFAVLAALEHPHGAARLALCVLWAPALGGCVTAAETGYTAVSCIVWERRHHQRLLVAYGRRQRSEGGPVIYTRAT